VYLKVEKRYSNILLKGDELHAILLIGCMHESFFLNIRALRNSLVAMPIRPEPYVAQFSKSTKI